MEGSKFEEMLDLAPIKLVSEA